MNPKVEIFNVENSINIKLFKCCRPLVIMLNVAGIDVKLNRENEKTSYGIWLVRLFVFTLACSTCSFQIANLSNGIDSDDLWIPTTNDHFIVFAFLYIICFRDKSCKKFTSDVLKLITPKDFNDQTFGQLAKMSWFLVIFTSLLCIDIPLTLYLHCVASVKCEEWFTMNYFELSGSTTKRLIVTVASEFPYRFTPIFIRIYSAYVTFLLYVIGNCYQNANKSFSQLKTVTVENISQFQNQHHKLNTLIDQFNTLFSPAILILTLGIIGSIIEVPGAFKDQKDAYSVFVNKPLFATYMIYQLSFVQSAKNLFLLVTLLKMAHKIHGKSRDVFYHLSETSFTKPELYKNSPDALIMHCSRSNFFSAQWMASPVNITASGFFTLDYALIGVIISVMITYWTIINDFQHQLQSSPHFNFTCLE
ncbi:hypothetical protein CHUAL_001270 [Chamberlinius hualienensis]